MSRMAEARLTGVAALTIGIVVLSGCGTSDSGSTAASTAEMPQQTAAQLWGREFVATAFDGSAGERPPIADPKAVHVSFTSPKARGIGWEANCNSFGSSLRITPTTLLLSEVGGTLVGCYPKFEREDDWLARFFEADPQWHLHGNELTLSSEGDAVELVELES
jgi:heat shock protein HslJ